MRKLILILFILLSCVSLANSGGIISFPGGGVPSAAVTGADCSGDIMFANYWEMATTTTSIETGNPYGCSDNATKTGTESGTVSISSAASDCTGSTTLLAAADSYVSYPLTMVGHEFKLTINFQVKTWTDYGAVFAWYADADDYILLYLQGAADDIEFLAYHSGAGFTDGQTTVGVDGVEDAWFQVVIQVNIDTGNELTLYVYDLNPATCETSNEIAAAGYKAINAYGTTPNILYFGEFQSNGASVVIGDIKIEGTSGL